MKDSHELCNMFFNELKAYNGTNFRNLATADLSVDNPVTKKCFSAVVTRYFIFREKHPELSEGELNLLYFKLKLDLVAQYFADYPDASTETLVAFQLELRRHIREQQGETIDECYTEQTASV